MSEEAKDKYQTPTEPSTTAVYWEAQKFLATTRHRAACEQVERFRKLLESTSGYPVSIEFAELPSNLGAVSNSAHFSGVGRHVVLCNRLFDPVLQQALLSHELMHLRLDDESTRAGQAKLFGTTETTRQFMMRLFEPELQRFRQQGVVPKAVREEAASAADYLILILLNTSLDLVVETNLRREMPVLSAAQFLAMGQLLESMPSPVQTLEKVGIMPRSLVCAGLALNCTRAMLHDQLFGSTTTFAGPYRGTDAFALAQQLWEHWRTTAPSLGPGDEYRLVDEFATILGLREAYEWFYVNNPQNQK